jgi:23S rRNA pseudouridine1911/1915/1917 synthase
MQEPSIIYEDEDIIALNKPSGLLVHGSSAWAHESPPTLVDWLVARYPFLLDVGESEERPGIVHRLDRDTSGVMVVAKTQAAFTYYKNLFKSRRMVKTYLALVHGAPGERRGTVVAPISIKGKTVKRTVFEGKMQREAVTDWEVLEKNPSAALLKVLPRTGRTHQIRVHMASIGHPIVGDKLYGKKTQPPLGAPRVMLHALSLEMETQEGERLRVEAAPPADFREAVAAVFPDASFLAE